MITLNNRNTLALVVSLLCINNNAYGAEGEQRLDLTSRMKEPNCDIDRVARKLGFPPVEGINTKIDKFTAIEKRHLQDIENSVNDSDFRSKQFAEDREYLLVRSYCCEKAIGCLPSYPQRADFASFILCNYARALTPFQVAHLRKFKKEELECNYAYASEEDYSYSESDLEQGEVTYRSQEGTEYTFGRKAIAALLDDQQPIEEKE